jgi:broad specificity phosphatase PhoE
MLIYVVRHGETNANVNGYLQGWSNDPLNENGIKLAVITGQGMKGIKFDCCISSPLIRAKETAEIILRESGNDISITFDDRIKEINFGDYELKSTKSPEFGLFFTDPFNCPQFPNGENVQMVMKRTQNFLSELIQRDDDESYLIVTHGCALRAMLNYLYADSSDYWHGHVPYNCCVSIIEVRNGNALLVADDKVYYDEGLIVDRYSK